MRDPVRQVNIRAFAAIASRVFKSTEMGAFQIDRDGSGKFILRFVSPASGKRRDMGLGTYPELGLAEARRLGVAAREEIARGLDPIAQRNAQKVKEQTKSSMPTFRQAALRVHGRLAPGFRNAKHSAQWIAGTRKTLTEF